MGHNLCCDVFGDHSEGEVSKSGLAFHGEAGQSTWKVTKVLREEGGNKLLVTLATHLQKTLLDVSRTFIFRSKSSRVEVRESVKSLVQQSGKAEPLKRKVFIHFLKNERQRDPN